MPCGVDFEKRMCSCKESRFLFNRKGKPYLRDVHYGHGAPADDVANKVISLVTREPREYGKSPKQTGFHRLDRASLILRRQNWILLDWIELLRESPMLKKSRSEM